MSELVANLEERLSEEHNPRPVLVALERLKSRVAGFVSHGEFHIRSIGPVAVRKTPEGWILSQAIYSAPAIPAGAPPEKPCAHHQCPSHRTISESAPTEVAHHTA